MAMNMKRKADALCAHAHAPWQTQSPFFLSDADSSAIEAPKEQRRKRAPGMAGMITYFELQKRRKRAVNGEGTRQQKKTDRECDGRPGMRAIATAGPPAP
eukprot:EG_transcript_71373